MLITPSMLAPFSAFPSRSPPSPQLTLSNRISCAPGVKPSSRITFWDFSPLGGHWRRSSSHTCSSQHCPPLAWCTYCYMYKSQCMMMMPVHVTAWRTWCYMYVQEPVHDDDTCTCQGTGAEGSSRLSPRCKGDTVTRAFYQHDWLGNLFSGRVQVGKENQVSSQLDTCLSRWCICSISSVVIVLMTNILSALGSNQMKSRLWPQFMYTWCVRSAQCTTANSAPSAEFSL